MSIFIKHRIAAIITCTVLLSLPVLHAESLIEVKNIDHFNELMSKHVPTVIEFYASWCTACNNAKPSIQKLATQHSDVQFLLVNIDNNTKLTQRYKVNAYPTFIIFDAQGNQVNLIRGNQQSALIESIMKAKK
jgi:thiol-disulfide isomerase/thioredoxin